MRISVGVGENPLGVTILSKGVGVGGPPLWALSEGVSSTLDAMQTRTL